MHGEGSLAAQGIRKEIDKLRGEMEDLATQNAKIKLAMEVIKKHGASLSKINATIKTK
jgi:hypothetical protein